MRVFKLGHRRCHKLIPSNGLTGVLLLAFLLRMMGTSSLLGDTKPDGKQMCQHINILITAWTTGGKLQPDLLFAWIIKCFHLVGALKMLVFGTRLNLRLESRLVVFSPPFLAIRPATENWVESLEAPLPLAFHCSSFSCKIFIRSAKDIFGSMSAEDF